MSSFKITLDGKEYDCSTSQSNGKGETDWNISVTHGNVRSTIRVPIENKVTRAKVLLFVEAFHVAMHNAFKEQQLDQNYIWNQDVAIR